MDNPLSKLALDYWYQVLMVIGIIVFLLVGGGLLKAYPTVPTALVSFGIFWLGLGEWINHPLQTKLMPATARFPSGVISGHPRNASFSGTAFDVLGIGLVIFGCYKFFA